MKDKIARRILELGTLGFLSLAFMSCKPQPAPMNSALKPLVTFKPQEVSDALHAVIAANHDIHFQEVMRQFDAGDTRQRDRVLESHARTLRAAAESIQRKGAEFHYVLRSLSPINPRSLPETAMEREGLRFVTEHRENFYKEESLGGRRYFIAVYPMTATASECADCHNRNAASPRKDFKFGDVMGGLIVRVPLEF